MIKNPMEEMPQAGKSPEKKDDVRGENKLIMIKNLQELRAKLAPLSNDPASIQQLVALDYAIFDKAVEFKEEYPDLWEKHKLEIYSNPEDQGL